MSFSNCASCIWTLSIVFDIHFAMSNHAVTWHKVTKHDVDLHSIPLNHVMSHWVAVYLSPQNTSCDLNIYLFSPVILTIAPESKLLYLYLCRISISSTLKNCENNTFCLEYPYDLWPTHLDDAAVNWRKRLFCWMCNAASKWGLNEMEVPQQS